MPVKFDPATDCNPQRGSRPVPANARVDDLLIDPAYQREMGKDSEALIRQIAKDWDWSLCQPLIVARRGNEGLFVVDGQHRLSAARARGDILDLPCVIIDFGDAQGEANAFVKLNTARRPLSSYAIWKAAIAGGDPNAIALSDLLARHNLRMTGNANKAKWKAGEINAVVKLQRMIAAHGVDHVDRVLGALVGAFGDEPLIHGSILIAALSTLFTQHDEAELPVDTMIRVLRTRNQDMWGRAFNARMATTGLGYQICAISVLRSVAFPPSSSPPPLQPPASSPGPAAAKPRLTHEQQLERVRSGQATVSEKLPMPSAVPQTHAGSSLA